MYAAIAALIAARVSAKMKKLKEEKAESKPHVQDALGMRLEKENQIMRLAKQSLRR